MINQQAPDALSLQEIGDPAALGDLIAELGGDWPGTALGRPDSRGIRVAWLTRHPMSAPTEIVEFPAPLKPVQVDDEGTTPAAERPRLLDELELSRQPLDHPPWRACGRARL